MFYLCSAELANPRALAGCIMEYGVKDMDIGGKKKGKDEGGEREPGRCALFIKKRGRYCKLPVAKGREYCGEHLTFDLELSGASSHKKRIPCPLDPHQYALLLCKVSVCVNL